MRLPVDILASRARNMWNSTSCAAPTNLAAFTRAEQIQKERELDELMLSVDDSGFAEVLRADSSRDRLISVRGRLQRTIVQLLHGFGCIVDEKMQSSFSRVTDDFIRAAYDFDPSITQEAVYQASRNVMIMNTFQMHLGVDVALTPSVFAYSLLYPYTDNYLDDASVSPASKHEANRRLRSRLRGIRHRPANKYERIIDELVRMIEREFERSKYPLVYEGLLAIHGAQEKSVTRQAITNEPDAGALLDLSIEKGGTSVLADAYLVAGNLAENDARFVFDFGVVLQLIDDLQDLVEDREQNQLSLAGVAADEGELDAFTSRLLSYLEETLRSPAQQSRDLYALIERSCRFLIFEAIAVQSACYENEFLMRMEDLSPVRFAYLRDMRNRLRDSIAAQGSGSFEGVPAIVRRASSIVRK